MKNLISILFTVLALSPEVVHAQKAQETITDSKAVITVCAAGAMDCGAITIAVKGKSYRAHGNTNSIQKQLENIEGAYQFQHMTQTRPFSVTGFITEFTVTNPSGWGPPAGQKVKIFNITSNLGSIPLPK